MAVCCFSREMTTPAPASSSNLLLLRVYNLFWGCRFWVSGFEIFEKRRPTPQRDRFDDRRASHSIPRRHEPALLGLANLLGNLGLNASDDQRCELYRTACDRAGAWRAWIERGSQEKSEECLLRALKEAGGEEGACADSLVQIGWHLHSLGQSPTGGGLIAKARGKAPRDPDIVRVHALWLFAMGMSFSLPPPHSLFPSLSLSPSLFLSLSLRPWGEHCFV